MRLNETCIIACWEFLVLFGTKERVLKRVGIETARVKPELVYSTTWPNLFKIEKEKEGVVCVEYGL